MSREDIRDRTLEYVKLHNMLNKGEKVVAGISGGADSMCLLGLLLEWRDELKTEITAVHVNHGIRGAAADEDEAFVRDFCEQNGVAFRAVHADIPRIARETGCTEEEAGRNFRYETFRKTARECGCSKIAVAHNRSDNVETVLFNILRGSGLPGLKGIPPVRDMDGFTIIRPLLETSRQEIEQYLAEKGMDFRTDATNNENVYARNTIRNIVLPIFREKINAASEDHIVRLIHEAYDTEKMVAGEVSKTISALEASGKIRVKAGTDNNEIRIDVQSLLAAGEPVRSRIIREMTGRAAGRLKDITSVHIGDVLRLLDKSVGKKADLPYNLEAVRDYRELVLRKKEQSTCSDDADTHVFAEADFEQRGPGYEWKCRFEGEPADGYVKLSVTSELPDPDFTKKIYTKFFDCDTIKSGVCVRCRRPGDYLMIRDGEGRLVRKSLKSWMIDNKIPVQQRDRIGLVAEKDHVLWIIGSRRDDSCMIGAETKRVLVAEFLPDD